MLARGPVRAAVDDRAWLAALLTAEAGLAQAQAGLGMIPPAAATAIAAAAQPAQYDVGSLAVDAAGSGTPVLPLVTALRQRIDPALREYVHYRATSQDILDTAAMLVSRSALAVIRRDLETAAGHTATLARRHRNTAMAGRTLLQQAEPTTFGRKAAGWLVALRTALASLDRVASTGLAVQLGGAAGTLAGYQEAGPALLHAYAAELGLAEPVLPWHTDRTRVAELAGALATTAGAAAKIARDITLLAQSEVAEVAEAAGGPSSAMPHKRNPVAAVSALAAAGSAPGLAATIYAAMTQEHERAAGGWHTEWRPLRELLICTGSAVSWLDSCLAGLQVNDAALAANLASMLTTVALREPAEAHTAAAAALVDRALADTAPTDGEARS